MYQPFPGLHPQATGIGVVSAAYARHPDPCMCVEVRCGCRDWDGAGETVPKEGVGATRLLASPKRKLVVVAIIGSAAIITS